MKLDSKTETKKLKERKKITHIENFMSKNKWNKWNKILKPKTEKNKSTKIKSKLGKWGQNNN